MQFPNRTDLATKHRLFGRATDEPTMIEPSGLIAWVGPQCLGDKFEL